MKTVYLHIGLHKTGTTSIQNFLFRHNGLSAEAGINVLKPCLGPRHGHHNIAWGIHDNHPRFTPRLPKLEDAAQQIKQAPDKRFLLSSEEFSTLDDSGIENIQKQLRDFRVRVILFIRNQADLLASMYAEAAKKNALTDLEDYVDQKVNKEWAVLNYRRLYQRWAAVFGADHIDLQKMPYSGF